MGEKIDRRKTKPAETRRYYIESGLVRKAAELYANHSQVEIAEIFTDRKYNNATGYVGWKQPTISKLLKFAREMGFLEE
ncbi:hypothetical protein KOR34_44780 [Posidoniimonas corsicana]|uniref:Uncharacterized protein n=1 Tax=Posidoniimonas corsicana TaxID=1938618 RepID=A0A5C5UXN1_9BACT|nr:hypothetical protein [Posidoniimonas corsicana]TWT31104.1 hypothetical protein KOR34_44780 [Posidoniimonas corsicana]